MYSDLKIWTPTGSMCIKINNTIEDGFVYSHRFSKQTIQDLINNPFSMPYETCYWEVNEDTLAPFFAKCDAWSTKSTK